MYSVGEELSRVQAHEMFEKYAHDDRISRPSYLEVKLYLSLSLFCESFFESFSDDLFCFL